MADDDERALEALRASPPASRSRRGRDGWSARRAAARRAPAPVPGRSPPGAARRRWRSRPSRDRSIPIWSAIAAASCVSGASAPASTQSASVAWSPMSGSCSSSTTLRARHDRARALVGVDQAGEAFQQGRLARAVAADQRQPVARRRCGRRGRGTASLRPGSGRGLRRTGLGVPSRAPLALGSRLPSRG